MLFSYYISPVKDLLLKRLVGVADLPGIMRLLTVLWADPNYAPYHYTFFDLRMATLKMNAADLTEISKFIKRSEQGSRQKMAILVRKPLETALAQIFEAKMAGRQEVKVFTQKESAVHFLHILLNDLKPLYGKESTTVDLRNEEQTSLP